MNFYDYSFIFIFFPLVVFGAWGLRRVGQTIVGQTIVGQAFQYVFLIAASLVFYASWDTAAPLLLVGSVLGNYALGLLLRRKPDRLLLSLAVAANLGVLGYCKY